MLIVRNFPFTVIPRKINVVYTELVMQYEPDGNALQELGKKKVNFAGLEKKFAYDFKGGRDITTRTCKSSSSFEFQTCSDDNKHYSSGTEE